MKVLLTGANGFVGSHILASLLARGLATAVLLRPGSNRRLIAAQLDRVEIHPGSLADPATLPPALAGVTHVIHCAGATKALSREGFFVVNEQGTRNLVSAVNAQGGVRRLVHISSLAAVGPAGERPVREDDPPQPVSDYGASKLAAERAVVDGCAADWTVLRPPAVYGPGDGEFLLLFQAAKAHLQPRFGGGRQRLSFVFVRDLAEVTVQALKLPAAGRRTYFVAAPELVTAAELSARVAAAVGTRTLRLPLPNAVLWLACWAQEWRSRWTRQPNVLSAQKYAELRAAAWTCDPTRLQQELGLACPTTLREGLSETLAWYRQHQWL